MLLLKDRVNTKIANTLSYPRSLGSGYVNIATLSKTVYNRLKQGGRRTAVWQTTRAMNQAQRNRL